MNGEDLARELGEIRTELRHLATDISNLSSDNQDALKALNVRLDTHVEREENRLKHIENQLSMARFLWMFLKVLVTTIALLLTFKFGDISGLWKALIK